MVGDDIYDLYEDAQGPEHQLHLDAAVDLPDSNDPVTTYSGCIGQDLLGPTPLLARRVEDTADVGVRLRLVPEGLGVREDFSVEVDHRLHHLGERLGVLPAQVAVGSGAVSLQDDGVDGALQVLTDRYVLGPVVDSDRGERKLKKFAQLVGLPGGEDVVAWIR